MSAGTVNYYDLLEVDQTASTEEIKKAINRQRKTWQKRQTAPDPQKRQTAEERMRILDEAHRTLLDPDRRKQYDANIPASTPAGARASASASAPGAGQSWIDRAREYLEAGDAASAVLAAREATTHEPENPKAWSIRGQASLADGKINDAVFELREAIRLDPTEPEYQFDLGTAYEGDGRFDLAMTAYEKAAQLEPANPLYKAAIASIYLQTDRPKQALPMFEKLVEENPENRFLQFYLANSLNEVVMQDLTVLRDGTHLITTEQQARTALEMLGRAKALDFDDRETRDLIDANYKLAEDALAVKWRRPSWLGESFWSVMLGGKNHPDGMMRGVPMAAVGCFLYCLLPGLLIVGAIGTFAAGGLSGTMFVLGACLAVYGGLSLAFRKPGWKINAAETRTLRT